MTIATYDDVLAIERAPLAERNIPATPYAMLRAGAEIAPDAPALTFFAEASQFKRTTVWSHRELFRRITQAGNLFRRLGVERGDAVAFILPNLPETHLAIWGGEAAGIAFAISPLLEGEQLAGLLKAVEPKLLVTLAPAPGTDLWRKATLAAVGLTNLRAVLAVDMAPYVAAAERSALRSLAEFGKTALEVPVLDFRVELEKERADALDFDAAEARGRLLVFLHRRHDRRAENRATHPLLRSVRRLGDDVLQRGPFRPRQDDLLRPSALPCERPIGDRPRALVEGRPCRHGHAARLPRRGRDRELLDAGRAFSHHHVLGRSDRLFGAPGDTDRWPGHREPGSGDLRRGPDARATLPGVPARNGRAHSRRLRPDGGRLRLEFDPARRPAARRLDRSSISLSGHARADPRRRQPICSRRENRRDRRHRHSRAQRLRRLSRSRAQHGDLDRARRARPGSTPETSADRTPTATSGSPGARRS